MIEASETQNNKLCELNKLLKLIWQKKKHVVITNLENIFLQCVHIIYIGYA